MLLEKFGNLCPKSPHEVNTFSHSVVPCRVYCLLHDAADVEGTMTKLRKRFRPEQPSSDNAQANSNLWEAEKIIGASLDKDGQQWFLIEWKGYGHEENTWEPLQSLCMANDLIHEFYFEFG